MVMSEASWGEVEGRGWKTEASRDSEGLGHPQDGPQG